MKKVAFLSFVAALGGILFGYDTAVISGTISAVAERFGLDAMAKGWYVGCALVGSIGGVAVAGWLSDRFGRKPTMLFSSVLFSVSAIGCAACIGFTDLVIYRIVGGVGIVLVLSGCDIVKNITTPSFMLVSGGLCLLLFALFHWVVDVKGFVAWSFPLRVVGMNALVAYLIQPIVPIGSIARFFFGGVASLTGCPDLVLAAGYCLICWLVLLFLYRHRVYVKV